MDVHFIAIGGSAMHNLAIALHKKGFKVTGSDDEVFEPSKSRLKAHGILPEKQGWFTENIHKNLDAIILGMHARKDNPELLEAQRLGIKVYSYPEYIYEQSKDKTRVVIGGSHGKTTITSMILHVLNHTGKDFDYMVGAQLEGFDTMVKLTKDAPIIILEGDEYLSSPIDLRPKFHLYKANIALISGIAWDHINVFPTFEDYVKQFKIFIDTIEDDGTLVYYSNDMELKTICKFAGKNLKKIPYESFPNIVNNNKTLLKTEKGNVELKVFGEHNMSNINGARHICNQLGIDNETFFEAIKSYKGAAKRLQIIKEGDTTTVFQDFAHSPSKLKATSMAVKEQFQNRKLVACLELHTFSSLTKEFLDEYSGAMNEPNTAIVYFNPKTIEHKKLKPISIDDIKYAFDRDDLLVYTDSEKMVQDLQSYEWFNTNLLMMSSGNFDGIDFNELADSIIQ